MKSINFLMLLIATSLWGCTKEQDPSSAFTKEKLTGYLQKGPFVNGSSLTVFELDERYAQTGKSFNTQILDNTGAFELSNISAVSNFVKIRADGFYFNEVANSNSQAPLTLYALSNLALSNTVNVNLLTSLEVPRAEYLLSSGSDFTSAKKQAQREVLKIFSITRPGIIESELLDISQNGDDNAILLAISVILQGYRTEAELSQLLGDINTDIRTDGILNSQATGSLLINDIKLINLAVIRNNLSIKYQSMGITATIPDFEKYVAQFIDSTSYTFNKFISYPYILDSKENLLYDSSFYVTGGIRYSFGAYLPIGTSIRVILKPSTGYNWNNGNIGFYVMENSGWIFDNNPWPDSTIFSANGNNQTVNIPVEFGPPTSTDFLIYENNAAIPARIKTIKN